MTVLSEVKAASGAGAMPWQPTRPVNTRTRTRPIARTWIMSTLLSKKNRDEPTMADLEFVGCMHRRPADGGGSRTLRVHRGPAELVIIQTRMCAHARAVNRVAIESSMTCRYRGRCEPVGGAADVRPPTSYEPRLRRSWIDSSHGGVADRCRSRSVGSCLSTTSRICSRPPPSATQEERMGDGLRALWWAPARGDQRSQKLSPHDGPARPVCTWYDGTRTTGNTTRRDA